MAQVPAGHIVLGTYASIQMRFPVLRNHAYVRTRRSGLRRTTQLCKCGVPTEAEAHNDHLHCLFTEKIPPGR